MDTIAKADDAEIIHRIIAGQTDLFEILIRRHNALLYKTGRSYNFDHECTQDLMQDTFIDAFCNLKKFEERSTFRTWLIRIMLNNCYRKKQKNGYKNEIPQQIKEKAIPMFSTNNNSDTTRKVLNREMGRLVETAIQNIPLHYRMVFSLREINGFSVEETAGVLNITTTNVKVRLNRAKALLRYELEKSYTAEDMFDFNLVYCDAMVKRVMEGIKSW
ncbi:MAG: sigma-70 family RNA polymerase sigma factor [Chitinophagaceae bacterium]|nr:MAG: sigma-70 family RNA polymerase sigma factor [Chitinophagaceae bacterium]